MLQGYLLLVAMLHQHPLAGFAGGASTEVSQGCSQPAPPLATELTCVLCQIVRRNLALPVAGSPAAHAVVSVSRLLVFCPTDYHSYQPSAIFRRAPPLS